MILGINGYAKSGKDTAAKLLQYVSMKENVSGMTVEEAVNDNSFLLELQSGWEIRKFSYVLKKVASLLTGFSVEDFEDQEFKSSLLPAEWGLETETPLSNIPIFSDTKFIHLMTVREFLQKLGTDAVRNGLHPNAWVNAAMAGYNKAPFNTEQEYERNWIFTDCRFPNEAQAIKDRGGYIIRIDRPGVKPVNDHPSETALDDWDFDYKIYNASDLLALSQTMAIVLELIKEKRNEKQTNS
jgi:hypothetical protein